MSAFIIVKECSIKKDESFKSPRFHSVRGAECCKTNSPGIEPRAETSWLISAAHTCACTIHTLVVEQNSVSVPFSRSLICWNLSGPHALLGFPGAICDCLLTTRGICSFMDRNRINSSRHEGEKNGARGWLSLKEQSLSLLLWWKFKSACHYGDATKSGSVLRSWWCAISVSFILIAGPRGDRGSAGSLVISARRH